jgi:hypothetical protein
MTKKTARAMRADAKPTPMPIFAPVDREEELRWRFAWVPAVANEEEEVADEDVDEEDADVGVSGRTEETVD